MDRLRIISASVLVPVSVIFAYIGGPPYVLYVSLIFWLAAGEYVNLMRRGRFSPSRPLVLGALTLFLAGAYLTSQRGRSLTHLYTGTALPEWTAWALAVTLGLLLLAMTWHVFDHERGASSSAIDWALTIAGGMYLGLFAAHFVLIREDLGTDGRWWSLVVLPATWIADSAAMLVGQRFGRHPLASRLSPGKTWEGYAAGIAGGLLGGALLGAAAGALAVLVEGATQVTWLAGLAVGGLCGLLTPLGDLGESMFKRLVNVKDSSNLVPGHGGMLDRTDSHLWAAVIGYYFFVFVLKGGL